MDAKTHEGVADSLPLPEIPQCSNPDGVQLTVRERQIAFLTAQGLQCNQIGEKLGIGTKTVKVYRTNIFRKIGHRGIAHVTRFVIRQGWMQP